MGPSAFLAMAKTARAVSVLLAGVCLCCLPAFVPGPGRLARSVAPAAVGAGALGMLGAAPAYADKIDDAAKVLSEKSYPFLLKEIDWTSDVYAKLPTQPPLKVMTAIDTMLKMGAAMDPAALKTGVLAHSQAIANMDSKGVATLADYTAIRKRGAAWWRQAIAMWIVLIVGPISKMLAAIKGSFLGVVFGHSSRKGLLGCRRGLLLRLLRLPVGVGLWGNGFLRGLLPWLLWALGLQRMIGCLRGLHRRLLRLHVVGDCRLRHLNLESLCQLWMEASPVMSILML